MSLIEYNSQDGCVKDGLQKLTPLERSVIELVKDNKVGKWDADDVLRIAEKKSILAEEALEILNEERKSNPIIIL